MIRSRFLSLSGLDKAQRLAVRAQSFIPPQAKLVPGPAGGAVYTYDETSRVDGRVRYVGLFFWGSAAKPHEHVIYRSAESRAQAIAKFHESICHSAEYKAKQSADKKAWQNPAKVGDILYTSWGYDQTNVEFYAVTRVSGKRVWVRRIAADSEATGPMQAKVWPAMPLQFIGEETMHLARMASDERYSVKINDSATAWLETGRTHCYCSWYA